MSRNDEAGMDRILALSDAARAAPETISVTSPAFRSGGTIPEDHTEDGNGLSPPLAWAGVPAGAASLLLVIEDADSATPTPLMHALVWDLPPVDGGLREGAIPIDGDPDGGEPGLPADSDYLPPDPPPGDPPHRYMVQILALDRVLGFADRPSRAELSAALAGRVLAKGTLVGRYGRE